ncbi:MAG: MATE family efflux transporter [Halioglobus sp.]|nr:MATE family efflux transporter [Halioglobus sp.]
MKTPTLSRFAGEYRALMSIAWPMLIAQLAQMGTGVVDTIMAGRYSATDLAAIAIGYNIWLPLQLFFMGVLLGGTTIVAQDFGAGRVQRIRDALPQALWLALLLGLVTAPLCYFAGPLLALLDLDALTHDKSLAYLQAVALGLPASALFQALRCHTQGIGIMRPFAVASVIGFLANIPLNYALIYGRWGAPEMGAAGCGWATAISLWLSPVLISIYMARSQRLRPYLPALRWVRPNWEITREILRVGLPMGLSFFLEVAVFSIIGLLIATLGNIAMASHQIAYNVWDVVYIVLVSLGSAMATRLGHAIGARDRQAVALALQCGGSMMFAVGLSFTLLLLSAPGAIIALYTGEPAILDMATGLIALAALFVLIDAAQVTTSFSLRAFKDTAFPFLVLCGAYWFLTLPLGYWLGIVATDDPGEGITGFWKAMILGVALSTAILARRLYLTLQRPLPTFPPGGAEGVG